MKHYDMVVKSRRYAKLFLFGLVSVICFLLFTLHNENKIKERLRKQKSDLTVKLSASKNGENAAYLELKGTSDALEEQRKQVEKQRKEVEEQRKQVEAQKKQSEELQRKFDTLSKSYKEKVSELETIKKNSSKIQERLDALMKQNGQVAGKMNSTASTTAHT